MFYQKTESGGRLGEMWGHNRVRSWKTVSETLAFVDLVNATSSLHKPIYLDHLS